MKKVVLSVLVIGIMSCANNTENKEQIVEKAVGEYYGDTITLDGAINTAEFLSQIQKHDSINVKLQAPISEVCQKKGCWMDLDLGNNQTMTVRFKDYGFFVPKDSDGKIAIIEGWAKKDTTSVELLRHYAEDAGKTKEEIEAITEPEIGYSFEANGVVIKPNE